MLDFLLRKLRPLEADDPFFGHLVYMKMPRGRISYWEARRTFTPTGREIELFIDAPAPQQPPSPREQAFFATVERDFDRIFEALEPILREEFEGWTGQTLAGSIRDEFTPGSFSIPDAALESAEWEISFESATHPGALFSVTLTGLTPTSSTVDD